MDRDTSFETDARCDRCRTPDDDLRVVLFWGPGRRADRFVCPDCAEALFQLFVASAQPAAVKRASNR